MKKCTVYLSKTVTYPRSPHEKPPAHCSAYTVQSYHDYAGVKLKSITHTNSKAWAKPIAHGKSQNKPVGEIHI